MVTAGDELKAELANVALDQVDLSTRARNCLINENISTIGQLAELSLWEIMRWPNAGKKTLLEFQELLGRLGLKLSDDPHNRVMRGSW
jgi:DNA-directed RNA polymerase subunit alpha